MAVDTKAVTEGPSSGGALVPPKYGVGDKCPECGMAMSRLPTGEVACKHCGFGQKKAVGFETITVETKDTQWEVKEVTREGAKGLKIRGYASTWVEDRDGDTVARNAFDESLRSYLSDNPVLLLDHKREQVLGEVTKGWTDEIGLGIEAFIPKPEQGEDTWKFTAYNDIKRGLRRALSMGGVFYRRAQKGISKVIEKVDLFEISNVAVPSNPKSLFRVIGEKGLQFSESKAEAGNAPDEEAEEHTHIEAATGKKITHEHEGATMGHAHPSRGLLPLLAAGAPDDDEDAKAIRLAEVKSALSEIKAGDPDGDAGRLAQAIDAALDEAIDELEDGDTEQGLALVIAAEQTVDTLLDLLNVDDPPDGDDDEQRSTLWEAQGDLLHHWKSASEISKSYPVVDEKGVTGVPRLHVHIPVGGKGLRSSGMGHSHAIDLEAEGHRHEGFRPYQHPKAQEGKMTTEAGKKGVADGAEGKGAETVTLTKEQFEEFQSGIKQFQEIKRQREVEEAAEAIADQKAAQIAEQEAKAAQEHDRFVTDVAGLVEAKLATRTSGRKYVAPPSGQGGLGAAGTKGSGVGEESMIGLLYQKAQGDPDARQKLREMSQKAAAEMGIKALVEGTTSGYLVPPQYMQQGIAEYRIAAAKVRQLCTTIGGLQTNLVYLPRETGIATVGWTAEGAPKPSTDQTFGQLAVNIFTLAGISKVSNQLLEDSNPAVDTIVRKDLGRLLGQAEDIAFLTGTGAGQPTGILNTAGILTGAIGGATVADAIASAIAAIQANYYGDPEAIVMNPKHLNVLRTAKDANNRYIFEPAFFPANSPMMRAFMENNGGGGANGTLGGGYSNYPSQGGPQGSVWGLPVYADANLPAPTNNGNIIVGAFSEAYVLERTGVTIDVSSEAGTSFEQNQTWFRGEERLGFTAARQPTAFYSITGLA